MVKEPIICLLHYAELSKKNFIRSTASPRYGVQPEEWDYVLTYTNAVLESGIAIS